MSRRHDRIVLTGLEFHGYHGYHPEEARLGARFVVDVELCLDLSGVGDDLAKTVDYSQVYQLVRDEVTTRRFYLIEALANSVADRLVEGLPQVAMLTVRIHKPHAPLAGVFRNLYVEVNRSRR